MKKSLLAMLLASAICLNILANGAFAQIDPEDLPMGPPEIDDMGGPPPGPGMHQGMKGKGFQKGGPGFMGGFKQLNLTEDQKQKLKAQREASKNQMKGLKDRLMSERKAMMQILFDPNTTKAQMYAEHDKVSSLQEQMAKIRLDNIAAFKAILTPEQKQKLQQLGTERMQKMEQRKAKMQERMKQFKNKRGQRGQKPQPKE